MNQDHYDLALYFFNHVLYRSVSESQIISANNYIGELINKGWTIHQIKNELDNFAKEYPNMISNVYTMQQIMSNKQPPNNLIDPDTFYYHNALRVVSPPPKLYFDKEKGQMIRKDSEYYLEMKNSFTMNDLLDYWYKSNEMQPNENNLRQDKGRFEYLLGFYDLDEILFMIDIAQDQRKEMKQRLLRNVFDLEKYAEDAKDSIKAKRSVSRMQGVDKIIRRRD